MNTNESKAPDDLRYTKSHEWVRAEGPLLTVGITDFAQAQLADITFVELPTPGARLERGGEAAVVESVKAAADIYAPVAGEVIDVNTSLTDRPEAINNDPYGEGWLFRLKADGVEFLEGFLTPGQYRDTIAGGE